MSTGIYAVLLVLLPAGTALAQVQSVSAVAGAPAPGLHTSRLSYQLNAGATFAGRFGSATYISPMATYQLTNRLRLFGGVTYLRSLPGIAFGNLRTAEGGARTGLQMGTNHYLIQGGGTYALSQRLSLTGSAWKDLTPSQPGLLVNPYAGFGNMGSGVNLRANYHITENLSVSGGVRVTQGVTPGLSPLGVGPGAW